MFVASLTYYKARKFTSCPQVHNYLSQKYHSLYFWCWLWISFSLESVLTWDKDHWNL